MRIDSTIVCWGDNEYGQADAPRGLFTAVTAGDGHSCGLRTDNTVACWGSPDPHDRFNLGLKKGDTGPPTDGQFTAIASGTYHTCGLRPDGTIDCWGISTAGGRFGPLGTEP